jgi:hypothetical protein
LKRWGRNWRDERAAGDDDLQQHRHGRISSIEVVACYAPCAPIVKLLNPDPRLPDLLGTTPQSYRCDGRYDVHSETRKLQNETTQDLEHFLEILYREFALVKSATPSEQTKWRSSHLEQFGFGHRAAVCECLKSI